MPSAFSLTAPADQRICRQGDGLVPIMNAQPETVCTSLSSSALPLAALAFEFAVVRVALPPCGHRTWLPVVRTRPGISSPPGRRR